jgi:predicted N-acyltransferase
MSSATQLQNVQQVKPVIFLDIDDVLCVHRTLNTRQVLAALVDDETVDADVVWQQIFHPAACENLRVLNEEFRPTYVISSSWTLHLDQHQLRETFQRAGIGFVAHNLHQVPFTPRDEDSYRLVEIEAWLDTYLIPTLSQTHPTSYLIIDDVVSGQSLLGSHLEDHTVFCDAWTGFTYPKLVAAQKILRGDRS